MAQMDINTEEIYMTEHYSAWKAVEPDEETTYHIEFGTVTVHFYLEEWEEFLEFAAEVVKAPKGKKGNIAETESYLAYYDEEANDPRYSIEMDEAILFFYEADWPEILELFANLK